MQRSQDVEMEADQTCKLTAYDEKQRNAHATGQEADDDDDDDDGHPHGGQRVQCQ